MSVRHLVHLVGLILLALSVALAATTLVALLLGDGDWAAFMITTAIAAVAGLHSQLRKNCAASVATAR